MNNMINNNKGQVFSIDVLFALVIITVVIGMSANAVDEVSFKISDYSAGKSLDRIATEAADILINTPGTLDWEKSNSTSHITPGLAQDNDGFRNTTKKLSFAKISQLKTHYDELMNNIIPGGGSSSLTIYPTNSAIKKIEVGNKTPSADVSEVAAVNRTVLVNFRDFRILVCIDQCSNDICPHYNYKGVDVHHKPEFSNITPGWNCKCFKVSNKDLNTTDFYILTDPSVINDNQGRWVLDRADKISDEPEIFQAPPRLINDKISILVGEDEEALIWMHVFTSADPSNSFRTYVVGVPKGTSPEEVRVEYLYPQPCFFVLKVWL